MNNESKDNQGYMENCSNGGINEFAVKGKNNKIRIFKNLDKAATFAIRRCQNEVRWQNNDLIIATKDMLDGKRVEMWKEIIKEVS